MASRSFEDVSADFRPRATGRLAAFSRWLAWLFAIAAGTLGVAYYLPLYRAHRVLMEEHERVTAQSASAFAALAETRGQLRSVSEARDALQAKGDAVSARMARERAALGEALASVRRTLGAKRGLTVGLRGDSVVVALPEVAPRVIDSSPPASFAAYLSLCDVASALTAARPERTIAVIAYPLEGAPTVPVMPAVPAGKWESPALRAAKVAEALESVCHLAARSVETVARGERSPDAASLEIVSPGMPP